MAGRRNEHNRETLRSLVIKAAASIVSEEGLTGLTARKIGAQLGYSPGNLYVLFTNLSDIIVHLNAATLDDMHAFCIARTHDPLPPCDRLRALARAYLEFAQTHRNRWLAVFEHKLTGRQSMPPWYQAKIHGLFSLVRGALADLRQVDEEALTWNETTAVWSAVHGVCVLSINQQLNLLNADYTTADVIETLIDQLETGLTTTHS